MTIKRIPIWYQVLRASKIGMDEEALSTFDKQARFLPGLYPPYDIRSPA